MLYKIILYVIFSFTLLVGIGSVASAQIQPYSVPTEEVDKYYLQHWSVPTQIVQDLYVSISPKIASGYEILEKVAYCESHNNPLAKNPNSSAKGRFQFIDSSWKHYGKMLWGDKWKEKNVLDYEDNTELAMYVYSINKLKDWEESKPCWSKLAILDS